MDEIAMAERTGIVVDDGEVLGYIPPACGSGSGSGGGDPGPDDCADPGCAPCSLPRVLPIEIEFGGTTGILHTETFEFENLEELGSTWTWEGDGPCGLTSMEFGCGAEPNQFRLTMHFAGGAYFLVNIYSPGCFEWRASSLDQGEGPFPEVFCFATQLLSLTATISVPNCEEVDDGGGDDDPPSPYVMGVTTGLDPVAIDDEDLGVLAFVNCAAAAGSGSGPNAGKVMYRTAWDTGIDLLVGGKWLRLVAFKKLECCQEIVPELIGIPGDNCCSVSYLPATLNARLESGHDWMDGATTTLVYDPGSTAVNGGRPTWFGVFVVMRPTIFGPVETELPFFFINGSMTSTYDADPSVPRCWTVLDFNTTVYSNLMPGAGYVSDLVNYGGIDPHPSTCEPFERAFDVARDFAAFPPHLRTMLYVTVP